MKFAVGALLEPLFGQFRKANSANFAERSATEGLGRMCLFHERLQISHNPLRALPVRRVAALGVDLQGGTGDRRREPLLFFAREEGILLPP